MAKENGFRKNETLGYAEFGAYLHRDNGGKASIKAYTSTNKPHQVDSHDETTRIAGRRYKIVEEELRELNGNKFYEKNIDNIQEELNNFKGQTSSSKPYNDYDDEEEEKENKNRDPESGLTHKTATLKNMIDNVMADNRFQWIAIVGLAVVITIVVVLLR